MLEIVSNRGLLINPSWISPARRSGQTLVEEDMVRAAGLVQDPRQGLNLNIPRRAIIAQPIEVLFLFFLFFNLKDLHKK